MCLFIHHLVLGSHKIICVFKAFYFVLVNIHVVIYPIHLGLIGKESKIGLTKTRKQSLFGRLVLPGELVLRLGVGLA